MVGEGLVVNCTGGGGGVSSQLYRWSWWSKQIVFDDVNLSEG